MTGIERLRELAGTLRENIGDMQLNSDSGPLWRIIDLIAYVKDAWNVRSNLDRQLERAQAKVERQQRHIEFVQGKCRERQGHIVELSKELAELRKVLSDYRDALGGMCERLGITDGTSLPEMPDVICEALDRRLMPEGYEWPRYEGGPLLRYGGSYIGNDGDNHRAWQIRFDSNADVHVSRSEDGDGFDRTTWDHFNKGERVRRPAILAVDGNRIEPAMDVWWVCEGDERGTHAERLHVDGIDGDGMVECSPYNGGTSVVLDHAELYVKKPVLDADGVPIHEGDTVWLADGRGPWKVCRIVCADRLRVICDDEENGRLNAYQEMLTHRAPVLAADGKPLREGEHVWHVETGTELVVKELPKPGAYQAVVVFAPPASHLTSFDPDRLTHERPVADTWERLEEDCAKSDVDYCAERGLLDSSCDVVEGDGSTRRCADCGCTCGEKMARDLVRRARALAERDAS